MRYSALLDTLQKLINYIPSQKELGEKLGLAQTSISGRASRNSNFTDEEIQKLEKAYNINILSYATKNNYTIDYYPDVFGSCGNGMFQFSTKREQIAVPKSALFKNFAPGKQYFIINAMGNSMEPVFYANDKLIVENYDGEQIIDNKPYLFCYKDEIFIKKLSKNVDQLMIISENKDYDTRKLEGEQLADVNIIGLVVGLMRDLR